MRILMFFTALVISSAAQAELTKGKSCDFNDFQFIQTAIETEEVRMDEWTRTILPEFSDVLMQEMGPKCSRMVETEFLMGIPELDMSYYLIETGSRSYVLRVGYNKVEKFVDNITLSIAQ